MMAGGGADAAVRWRDIGMTGQRKTGSGKQFHIAPLFIRKRDCQRLARSSNMATRAPMCTSADVIFRKLTTVHRGRAEIDKGLRMGKPRSNGRRVNKLQGQYGSGARNILLFFLEVRAQQGLWKSTEIWVFSMYFCENAHRNKLG